jgi:hypothetical protein
MRIKSCLRIALTALLLAAAARQAQAVVVEIQLTPKNLITQDRSFKVETKDVDGLKQFEVTFQKTAGKLSPVFLARLHVVVAGETIASVPIEVTRWPGKVTCWFRVSPKSLVDTKFELHEPGYGFDVDAQGNPSRDEWGNVRFEPMPGGTHYWFYLRDFANPRAADAPREKELRL